MTKNVTLRLDEAMLKRVRKLAIDDEISLSQWVTNLVLERLSHEERLAHSRERALRRLEAGLSLGGARFDRGAAHER